MSVHAPNVMTKSVEIYMTYFSPTQKKICVRDDTCTEQLSLKF